MKLGMLGLPNVGKSTLFNALTNAGAESANYPFCTIEPNVGIVSVPDERLDKLAEMFSALEFEHSWADECFGCNLGRNTYKNGKFVESFSPEEGSEEACKFAAEIIGYDPREEESAEDNEEQPEI